MVDTRSIRVGMRAKKSRRHHVVSLLFTYLRKHNTTLFLPRSPWTKKGNQGSHTVCQVLIRIKVDVILCTRSRSQVVLNREHGFSKIFNPAGCTNRPS